MADSRHQAQDTGAPANAAEAALLRLALDYGADKAAWVDIRRDVVFDAVFRELCASNACGEYGKCHMCPPDVGDIHALMAAASAFDRGLLYQTVSPLEDSFDIEGMVKAASLHAGCAGRIHDRLAGVKGLLHLSTGGCHVCEICAKRQDLPCPYPEKALSSLEAYGIDVYKTARNAGLKYHHGEGTVTYFGMVLARRQHLE